MDTPADPGREAWMLLFRLFRSQRREMDAFRQEFELNPAQVHLLLNVDSKSGSPMNELAESLTCDASYITGLVDKLEARGLVVRTPKPEDRRIKLIALTDAGRDMRRQLKARFSQPPPFITALPRADQEALRDIFSRAVGAVQAPPLSCDD